MERGELSALLVVLRMHAVEHSDDDLVRRVVRGDSAAFGLLVERHTLVVYRIVRRMSSDQAEAEAITQEAFLRAWEGLKRSKNVAAFLPWLIRIAVNAARDVLKRSRPFDFADLPGRDCGHQPGCGRHRDHEYHAGLRHRRSGSARRSGHGGRISGCAPRSRAAMSHV